MTNDERLEVLYYAKSQAIGMHRDANEKLPDSSDKQLFLYLMECAVANIDARIKALNARH